MIVSKQKTAILLACSLVQLGLVVSSHAKDSSQMVLLGNSIKDADRHRRVHQSIKGPLRVHPDNSRYFTDDSGRAIYLTGSHTWLNLQDGGSTFPPQPFDYAEYLDLILAVKVVDNMDEAISHIARYGSLHTETIVTDDYPASQKFLKEVNSSTVIVNAATRMSDGYVFGLGAEIGISTTKIHSYGPMGVEDLTTTKFIVLGDGQIRQ